MQWPIAFAQKIATSLNRPFKMGLPWPLIVLFKHKLYRKTVGICRIQTHIVGVEGNHADHVTIIMALNGPLFANSVNFTVRLKLRVLLSLTVLQFYIKLIDQKPNS